MLIWLSLSMTDDVRWRWELGHNRRVSPIWRIMSHAERLLSPFEPIDWLKVCLEWGCITQSSAWQTQTSVLQAGGGKTFVEQEADYKALHRLNSPGVTISTPY